MKRQQACDPTRTDLQQKFADVDRLRHLRSLIESCPVDGPATMRLIGPAQLRTVRHLAVLPGSFNPPTEAHLELVAAAMRSDLGPVVFALSTRTIDKERLEGAMLEDRLLLLELLAKRCATGVALVNRGLYVDQAELLRAYHFSLEELTFLVGYDKIVQIFDPRYYDDREGALARLFAVASFAVAPRARASRRELAELLGRPENCAYADRVRLLPVSPGVADLSSSEIRAALAAGLPLPPSLPLESQAFIEATGCYLPPALGSAGLAIDRYGERRALVASLGA